MSIEAHIKQLEMKHQNLDEKLNEMLNSPSASNVKIAELKRKKLQLKDKIRRMNPNEMSH